MTTTIDTPCGTAGAPVDLGYTQAELDRAFDRTQSASHFPTLVRLMGRTRCTIRAPGCPKYS